MSFDLVKAIGEAIAQDTVFDRSNLGVIHYLKDLMSCFDFEIIEQTTEIQDTVFANLVGIKGPTSQAGGLILSSPLDTGHPEDSREWTACAQNPWAATVVDGLLFGLGANSGKADFLCKLKAAAEFDSSDLSKPLILVATFGRHLDLFGMNLLLDAHQFTPRRVLVGAPTNLELVHTTQSQVSFRCVIDRVDNTQDPACCQTAWGQVEAALREHLARLDPQMDDRFRRPTASLRIDSVEGDGSCLAAHGVLKFLPDQDVTMFLEHVASACADIAETDGTVSIALSPQSGVPPFSRELDDPFVQQAFTVMRSIGLLPASAGASLANEASIFARHGYDALVFGPGWPVDVDPGINEAIQLDHLDVAVAFYREMIRRNCT